MHSHQRARGKVLFEVLCALALAASLAGAWDQTGSSALLAAAAVIALFAIYWAFGLFAREPLNEATQLPAAVAESPEPDLELALPEEVYAPQLALAAEPEPFVPEPKKRRARKAKTATADVAPMVEPPEPVAIETPVFAGPPPEQLFDTQPFVRQPRAFGRKARGPRPLPAA